MLHIRRAAGPVATAYDAVVAARALHDDGLAVSLERRSGAAGRTGAAAALVEELRELLAALGQHAAPRAPELVLLLPALATPLATDVLPAGHARSDAVVLDRARQVCRAARNAGVGVTVDTDDRLPVDRALGILRDLRKDFPETGVVVHAGLRRAEADCRGLAHEGSHVRLVPGRAPVRTTVRSAGRPWAGDRTQAAYTSSLDADRSFVRCLRVLMAGHCEPAVATADPQLLRVARALAGRHARSTGSYELVLPRGAEALRRTLVAPGESVRVSVRWGVRDARPRLGQSVARAVDRAFVHVAGRAADLSHARDRRGSADRWPGTTDRPRRTRS